MRWNRSLSHTGRRSRSLLGKKKKVAIRPKSATGCPMVRGRACWCRMICTPVEGIGVCGRDAPHSMLGRTQLAIARQLQSG